LTSSVCCIFCDLTNTTGTSHLKTNIKFHGNLSGTSRTDTGGRANTQTDGRTWRN